MQKAVGDTVSLCVLIWGNEETKSNRENTLPEPKNYKKLNQISKLSQLPIPRVDQVLDSMGSGRVFSLFDVVSSFYQINVHKDTVPLQRSAHPRASTSGSFCLRVAALRLGGSSR